jgi:hypothetical protein
MKKMAIWVITMMLQRISKELGIKVDDLISTEKAVG